MSYNVPFNIVKVNKIMPCLYQATVRFRTGQTRSIRILCKSDISVGDEVAFRMFRFTKTLDNNPIVVGKNLGKSNIK